MTTTPQNDSARDSFAQLHTLFGEMLVWLDQGAHETDHVVLETGLRTQGNELLRAAYQAHLDQRFRRERSASHARAPGGTARTRIRHIVTLFGRVTVRRVAFFWRTRGTCTTSKSARRERLRGLARNLAMPADARLSLPLQSYSAPLTEQAVIDALHTSYDHAGEQIDRQTAGHIPHRQMIQIVASAAQDIEAFYAQREPMVPANDTLSVKALEVMSVDGTGVRMRPEGLREETRKLAEQQAQRASKGDPMAQRQARSHTHRMAVVTANWEQEPLVRTPEDILRDLKATKTGRSVKVKRVAGPRKDLPKPQNKRVRGSLAQTAKSEIEAMFVESDRRDPERVGKRVVLVDGSECQKAYVLETAARMGVVVTLILDVIHVLHYLWKLSELLTKGEDGAREEWVRDHLMRLMTRPAWSVISGIRQSATHRGLKGEGRKRMEAALGYLSNNADLVDYGAYLAAGMPIATGVIEGSCRHLVKDRMAITGARWGLLGAEAVLTLRSVWASGDWDAYWAFHLRQEHLRNYPMAEAA